MARLRMVIVGGRMREGSGWSVLFDGDLADDCYSNSELPDIVAAGDDDDNDEPIREPDAKRSRVDADYP